jgi:glycosyltransferase involved in cell wall biosynthesis
MKASIVIPAHNEETYIADTLRAVLAQDYSDFEVIVVDNASSDKTYETASGFKGVKVVREARRGLLWARERGRNEASGEIIVNIDADCQPEQGWLARGMSHFDDARCAAVTGPYDYFDGAPMFRYVSLISQKILYSLANFTVQRIGKGAVLIGGNSFIRGSALKAAGGYDTSITFYGEDTDTARRVSKQGRVLFDTMLVQRTSARRFKSEGTLRILGLYFFHFFRVIFAKSQSHTS